MTVPEYNCSLCKKRYVRDKNKQYEHQKRKGCFEVFPDPILFYRGDSDTPMQSASKIVYNQCYSQFFSNYWAYWINAHGDFEKGVMPFAGNLLEQPAKIVESFKLIHNLKEELRLKEQRVLERHGKRSKR